MRSLLVGAVILGAFVANATSTTPHRLNSADIPKQNLFAMEDSALSDGPKYVLSTADRVDKAVGKCAFVRFNASQGDLGWDYLEAGTHLFQGDSQCPSPTNNLDSAQPFASLYAGVAEGLATADRIKYNVPVYPWVASQTRQWIYKHLQWMQEQVEKYGVNITAAKAAGYIPTPPKSHFWAQVQAILMQIEGLADGYNSSPAAKITGPVTFFDMFLLNFGAEIGDVDIAIAQQTGDKAAMEKYLQAGSFDLLKPRQVGAHCSALIKPTHDDLFMAHDTWSGFEGMSHRIYKKYAIGVGTSRAVTLSSYPGAVASGDDWYQVQCGSGGISAGACHFAVQETTNEVFNKSLYANVVPQTVSEFIRVMVANYKAYDGEEWTSLFGRHNSGTYNNQYMVVDFNKYAPGVSVTENTLWIAEQIPGLVQRGDVSDVLSKQGYWASYNIPYFWNIFDLSGYKEMEAKQGSFWSYAKYSRPEIFKRNNTDVHDVASMMKMMRYNNYQHDPLSVIPNCTGADPSCLTEHSSMLTIASRGDLMKVYSTKEENIKHYGPLYGFVAQGCFGAIDSKIASWKNRRSMTSYAISGPTNDQQPTFSYGGPNCPHAPEGSPVTFDFPWLEIIN